MQAAAPTPTTPTPAINPTTFAEERKIFIKN